MDRLADQPMHPQTAQLVDQLLDRPSDQLMVPLTVRPTMTTTVQILALFLDWLFLSLVSLVPLVAMSSILNSTKFLMSNPSILKPMKILVKQTMNLQMNQAEKVQLKKHQFNMCYAAYPS